MAVWWSKPRRGAAEAAPATESSSTAAAPIDFASGANNGLICGNTGDTVVILPADRADLGGMAASRLGSRCPIREVYPLSNSPG